MLMHKREVAAKFPPGAGCVVGSTASGRQRHASDSFEHRVGPGKELQRVFERDHTGVRTPAARMIGPTDTSIRSDRSASASACGTLTTVRVLIG